MDNILDTIDDLEDLDDEYTNNHVEEGLDDENFFNDPEEDEDFASDLTTILDQESEMGESEAREITDAIKSAATATYVLLAKAHEGKAYKSLGYDSWGDYVKTEFEISPQRSYQLLDLSKAVKMIESAAPEGTTVKLTEAQARDLKRELPRITERIQQETQNKTPEESREIIDGIVREEREEKAQQRAEANALKSKEEAIDEARTEGYQAGIEASADAILEADAERQAANEPDGGLMDVEVHGDNSSPAAQAAYIKLAQLLVIIAAMPDPQDVADAIPDNNFDELFDRVIDSAGWMNRLASLMELRD